MQFAWDFAEVRNSFVMTSALARDSERRSNHTTHPKEAPNRSAIDIDSKSDELRNKCAPQKIDSRKRFDARSFMKAEEAGLAACVYVELIKFRIVSRLFQPQSLFLHGSVAPLSSPTCISFRPQHPKSIAAHYDASLMLTVDSVSVQAAYLVVYEVRALRHIQGLPDAHRVLIEVTRTALRNVRVAVHLKRERNKR
jgi:hypothetical protein